MLGKNATKIFVASAGMEKFFPSEKLLVTGNPVRRTIAYSTVSKVKAFVFWIG
jgi:UDP-N-acetylglucosamine--N-acetylmuramyl-(pentapeptide) pyrophosphoryl-undecaprenol N-acetylglucosamine transferase